MHTTTRFALAFALASCSAPAPAVVSPPPVAAPIAPAPLPDPVPPAFRLSGDVVPVSYGLELTVVPTSDHVDGIVRIHAKVVKPTRVVWLNARGITIKSAPGDIARVLPGGEQFVGLVATAELPVGPLELDARLLARRSITRRAEASTQRPKGAETYAYTFFEPIDARRAFPCFDEPAYKVPWQLTFHIKSDHIARGNAPSSRRPPRRNGMKRVELAPTKPLPSYLVAFMVGPFEDIDDGTAGRVKTPDPLHHPQRPRRRARVREAGHAEGRRRARELLRHGLPVRQARRRGRAAVLGDDGASRHRRDGPAADADPPRSADRTSARTATRTSSRTSSSHYWFGDLVTMAWWDDTWLNEALGEWLDVIITDAAEPTWQLSSTSAADSRDRARCAPTRRCRRSAIRQPVTTNEGDPGLVRRRAHLPKGSTVLRQIETLRRRATSGRRSSARTCAKHAGATRPNRTSSARCARSSAPRRPRASSTYITRPGVPRDSRRP